MKRRVTRALIIRIGPRINQLHRQLEMPIFHSQYQRTRSLERRAFTAFFSFNRFVRICASFEESPDHFDAPVLFGLILSIAAMWQTHSPDFLSVVGVSDPKRRREIVREAVERLLVR